MKKRHIFVFLGHIACFFIYAHRFVFSVAIVAMVGSKDEAIQYEAECPNNSVSSNHSVAYPTKKGEFQWNEKQQGFILGSFYHGYIPSLALGGLVLSKWRAKYVFGVGILLCSILTALTPVAARSNFVLLYAVRFLIGK